MGHVYLRLVGRFLIIIFDYPGFFGFLLIAHNHRLDVRKRIPAKSGHVDMDDKVEDKHVRHNDVGGVDCLHDVMKQNVFSKGKDIAEEEACNQYDRGEYENNASIGKLLKRIEFLIR